MSANRETTPADVERAGFNSLRETQREAIASRYRMAQDDVMRLLRDCADQLSGSGRPASVRQLGADVRETLRAIEFGS